jgi:hypothetical protein
MFTKLIYFIILMKKVLILLIIILLISFVFLNKEHFYNLHQDTTCNKQLDTDIENINDFDCGENDCCVYNKCGKFCNNTNLSESSLDSSFLNNLSEQERQKLINYNVTVDPDLPYCVDFCVKTYTNTDPNEENFGEFKDENKLSTFISSKCSECINNHYTRLGILKDPYVENQCQNLGGKEKFNISVGSSNNVSKIITLPENDIVVDPIPTNRQNSNWRDRFSVKVDGRELTVTRIDQISGWGQNLQLSGKKDRPV